MAYFSYVQDAHLSPPRRPYTQRVRTVRAIFHMVGGTMTVQAIHEMHKADFEHGYTGIAYNIYISKKGVAYWGRGLEYAGGAVKTSGKTAGMNANSIHIVCDGDFDHEQMSPAQKETLFRVAVDVVKYFNFTSASQLCGHGEVGDTSCPGKNFPMEELRNYIRNYGRPVIIPVQEPTPEPPKLPSISKILSDKTPICDEVKLLQQTLKNQDFYFGKIDGDFGPKTTMAVVAFQKSKKLKPLDGKVGQITTEALGLEWTGKKKG